MVKYEVWRLRKVLGVVKYEVWKRRKALGVVKYEVWKLREAFRVVKYEFWRPGRHPSWQAQAAVKRSTLYRLRSLLSKLP